MGHTATLLADGTVLIAGGMTGPFIDREPLASAELFDPATARFHELPSMAHPRAHHTATLLQDGRVLIIAGQEGAMLPLASAELFAPATRSWSELPGLPLAVADHTATLLGDGRVLVAGGWHRTGYQGAAYLFDPIEERFSPVEPMIHGRSKHAASVVGDEVLVSGGEGDGSMFAELYSPTSGAWSPAGSLGAPRRGHTQLTLNDGRALVVSGLSAGGSNMDDALLFDPSDRSWSLVVAPEQPRHDHASVLLDTGDVLIVGGQAFYFDEFRTAEVFEAQKLRWIETEPLTRCRSGLSATLLADGRVLIVGGSPTLTDPPLAETEVFTPGRSHKRTTAEPAAPSAELPPEADAARLARIPPSRRLRLGRCLRPERRQHRVIAIDAAEEGDLLVWSDGAVHIASFDGQARDDIAIDSQSWSVALARDGSALATTDGGISVWDLRTGEKRFENPVRGEGPTALAFSPDLRAVVGGDDDGNIWSWDAHTGTQRWETETCNYKAVYDIGFAPDGRVVVSSWNGYVHLLDADSGKCERLLHMPTSGNAVAVAPDGNTLVAAGGMPTARPRDNLSAREPGLVLWDLDSSSDEGVELSGHFCRVTGVVFAGANVVASVSEDGTIRLWDCARRLQIDEIDLKPYADYPSAIGLLPSGELVVGTESGAMLWFALTTR